MKRKFRIQGLCLCLILFAVFCFGCNKNRNPGGEAALGFEVWGAPSTEKILQNLGTDYYSDIKESAGLTIDSAKNDYENDQIIISAKTKVKSYTVELFDLTHTDGQSVFKKENISVYNYGYANVTVPSCDGAPSGWYPDMILPFDKAVEAGENKVEAGNNQGIFFSFYTPADQKAGTYNGKVVLTVDGNKIDVPVTLRVRATEISSVVHSKTRFSIIWHYFLGEYDSSQHMLDQYTEMLLDYYVSPGQFMREVTFTEENAKYYAEKAYEFGSRDSCSTIVIPKSNSGTDMFATYIKEIAYKGLENNYNLIKKCYALGPDEPAVHNNLSGMKEFAETFKQGIDIAVKYMGNADNKLAYLSEHSGVDPELYDEVVNSISGIRYVTSIAYRDDYEPYVDIWCPLFHNFEPGYELGQYDDETELWFYGAISPRTPYPSYHISNTQINTRMLGWLQSIYNVSGNLYWAADHYSISGAGQSGFLDEYYGTNPYHYPRFDGEGYLVYPGAKYGIDGPIPTIRLDAIRDGYEEYEIMYALKEAYASVSEKTGIALDGNDVIKDIASSLYSGMKVSATEKTFAKARGQLLSLSEFTNSGACFVSHTDDGEGTIRYELYIPDGVTVDTDGLKIIEEKSVVGGKIFTYEVINGDGIKMKAVFKTTVDGIEVAFERNLPGTSEVINADELMGKFDGTIDNDNSLLVDGNTIGAGEGQYYKIAMTQTGVRHNVRISAPDLISKFTAKTDKAAFTFFYTGDEELSVEVYVKYKNKTYPQTIASRAFVFEPGQQNTITWENISGLSWDTLGDVEYVTFYFGTENAQVANEDVYVKNMTVYYVRED